MNATLFFHRSIACLAIFILYHMTYGQEQSVFHALPEENNTFRPNVAFVSTDTIPLDNIGIIYSLSVDITIHQPQESSFTRLVLEDKDGNDYLVAESNWFRYDTTIVSLEHYCEETAILDGVTPTCLKCYVTNDANVIITGIHTSDQPGTNDTDTVVRFIKEMQAKDIVDRINKYNTKRNISWTAAITDVSLMPYNIKKNFYEGGNCDSYLSNLQYYSKGLFEIGESRAYSPSIDSSPFVPNFDWRNRHGRSWLTSVKSQAQSMYCVPFASVGMLESNMMLHYKNADSIDLSEQYVASYGGSSFTHGTFGLESIIKFLKTDGTIDDASMRFVNSESYEAPTNRPVGNEHAYLGDYDVLNLDSVPMDTLKKFIIHRGPGLCGYHVYLNSSTNIKGGHAMTLAGYGTITSDTTYIYIDGHKSDTIIQKGDSLIGRTFWIYKNSNGVNWGHRGYMYVIYSGPERWIMNKYAFFPKGKPISNVSRPILCEDLDGDGYFNCGLETNSFNIPVWAQSDGDDSNPTIGHLNEYGYCEELPYSHPTYEYIYNDSTLVDFESSVNYIGILRGATLTLQAQPSYENGTKILLDRGATLIIDGFTVNFDFLQPYPGCTIILRGRAKVQKPFNVPLGVRFIIEEGSIE